MTGIELIKWILKNDAEDLLVLVDYRDSGGSYNRAGRAEPELMQVRDVGTPYDFEGEYVSPCEKPNAIVL